MKIAICNETYRDWSFEDAFRHARQAGYDGIEIAPFTIHRDAYQIGHRRCQEIVDLARQHDLQIAGLHWLLAFTEGLHLTSVDEAVRQKTAEYLGRLAVVCRWLGGEVMVLGSPDQRNRGDGMDVETANRLAVDCLQRVLPTLREQQVVLALEPLGPEEGNFMLTAEWGRELVDRVDSGHVRLHLDVKAMSTEEKPIPQIIRESRHDLVHFHCNDPNRRGPGMGDVCFRPVISALRSVGYDGWLSVEVFDDSVPPEEMAMQSIRYLRDQLGQAKD